MHLNTAYILGQLADLFIAVGNYLVADSPARRALAVCEQHLGPEHPETARNLQTLGHLYASQGKYGEADSVYQWALAIREQRLGPDHPETAECLPDLADLAMAQKRYADAEALFQRVLAVRTRQLGPEPPDTRLSQERYASLLQERKTPGERVMKIWLDGHLDCDHRQNTSARACQISGPSPSDPDPMIAIRFPQSPPGPGTTPLTRNLLLVCILPTPSTGNAATRSTG